MFYPFFALAARSPTRRRAFRHTLAAHLLLIAGAAWLMSRQESRAAGAQVLGHLLLVAGIVEGATLVGWRLTQLPKSRALEFLLLTPLRPPWVLVAEALVGLVRLALVTLAGLPALLLFVAAGRLDPLDVLPLLVLPLTWGAATGLGLTVWAYEPLGVRRASERFLLGLVLLYLVVGVVAGENLVHWLDVLPPGPAVVVLQAFAGFHAYNPFAVMRLCLEGDVQTAYGRAALLQAAALATLGGMLLRAARRLRGHFEELHYEPEGGCVTARRPGVGPRPLTWWAVRRVSRYSGRINLWLAGGFGVLYALYLVAGPHWPAWMGRRAFQLCDAAGGVAGLTTALVILAAVPAAFQYGLWDSNAPDRCRRLELLLLTGLKGNDYWHAAAAAAARRGRGYFAVAGLIWAAAAVAGRTPPAQALAAAAAGVLLWGLYFAVGFRAFTRGAQANALGLLLTGGLPLGAYVLTRLGGTRLGGLTPPGAVFGAGAGDVSAGWLVGPVLAGVVALEVARRSRRRCDAELRCWYDRHHSSRVVG